MKYIISLIILTLSMPVCAETTPAFLKGISESLNKNLPFKINYLTTAIKAEAVYNNLIYTYRMPATDITNVKYSDLGYFKMTMLEHNLSNYCDDTNMKPFVDRDVTISYIYKDKFDNLITRIDIPASLCK